MTDEQVSNIYWIARNTMSLDEFKQKASALLASAIGEREAHEWAPARIWLQREQGEGGSHTWCEDSVGDGDLIEEVEYVRAALTASLPPVADDPADDGADKTPDAQ